jgi:3-oxoacid CoA-transferase subunit A
MVDPMLGVGQDVSGKVFPDAGAALADLPDGASLACGGFGVAGAPIVLMHAVVAGTARDLEIISNNGALADWSMGPLLGQGRVRRVIASHIGSNRELQRNFIEGRVEIELTPQGTLAERLRAGGHGIAAFFTPTGVGTFVESGGLPQRYAPDGTIALTSEAKEVRDFDGRRCLLETALRPDFALVHAWRADRVGNLVFRKSARNFNPVMAMAARVTVAQVEELVEVGQLDPDAVHLPGLFVDRIVQVGAEGKWIEQVTTRQRPPC